jgi:SNF2 family DNA or RNA helicase
VLDLRFSTFAGRAQVSCDTTSANYLHRLRGRYASARTISSLAFDVEIDDLLVNLNELAIVWPPGDHEIHWQPELLAVVEGNAKDSAAVESRLAQSHEAHTNASGIFTGQWEALLTDFQRRDMAKLWELSHGANFSVPGAGKTRVTLALFDARRRAGEVRRMLVVCPKSAFESWHLEANLCHTPSPPHVAAMDGAVPPSADIVLINYERLPDARVALLQWLRAQPALLVLDEAHRMKRGPGGVWGAVCLALGPYAAKRLILTGTPAPNGAKDLENLLAFVWPGQGRAAVSRAMAGKDLRGASVLLKPLFVRTTKAELQLPPVAVMLRRVAMPPLHRELYNALLGQFSGAWRGDEEDVEALGRVLLYLLMAATTPALLATGASRHEPLAYRVPPLQPPAGSSLASLMRDLPRYELSPKYQEVLAIVAANAERGRKTLVWSTFVRNLTSLERLLARFNPALVHGGSQDRDDQLKRFRSDPRCYVLLSNPATLGEGVSLHHVCHDAVYVDRDFAAGRFLQSMDRIHRLGLPAETETRVTVLVSSDTLDEIVEQRLAMKLGFMGSILDDPDVLELGDLAEEPTVLAGMDEGDVRALLSYLTDNASS